MVEKFRQQIHKTLDTAKDRRSSVQAPLSPGGTPTPFFASQLH
jgi:hypothetical protein